MCVSSILCLIVPAFTALLQIIYFHFSCLTFILAVSVLLVGLCMCSFVCVTFMCCHVPLSCVPFKINRNIFLEVISLRVSVTWYEHLHRYLAHILNSTYETFTKSRRGVKIFIHIDPRPKSTPRSWTKCSSIISTTKIILIIWG